MLMQKPCLCDIKIVPSNPGTQFMFSYYLQWLFTSQMGFPHASYLLSSLFVVWSIQHYGPCHVSLQWQATPPLQKENRPAIVKILTLTQWRKMSLIMTDDAVGHPWESKEPFQNIRLKPNFPLTFPIRSSSPISSQCFSSSFLLSALIVK